MGLEAAAPCASCLSKAAFDVGAKPWPCVPGVDLASGSAEFDISIAPAMADGFAGSGAASTEIVSEGSGAGAETTLFPEAFEMTGDVAARACSDASLSAANLFRD